MICGIGLESYSFTVRLIRLFGKITAFRYFFQAKFKKIPEPENQGGRNDKRDSKWRIGISPA